MGGELFSSDIMWWLGDWNTTDPAPAPVASKEPEKGKNYFGLYLLVGGLKPYTIESDMETTIALAKTHDPLPQAASSGDLAQGFR